MSNKANWTVGRVGPQQKEKARARLTQACASCGSGKNLTLDHKVARAHGGTNCIDNLQMLCERCNFAKSQVEQQISAAQRQSGTQRPLQTSNESPVEMSATLFLPCQPLQLVAGGELCMTDPTTGFAQETGKVPALPGCAPGLVNVLASGPD